MLHSLAAETLGTTADELAALPDGCLTPGGLNEQVLYSARKQGIFDSVRDELDAIVDREMEADRLLMSRRGPAVVRRGRR